MTSNSLGGNIWGYDTRVVSATLDTFFYKSIQLWNPIPYVHAYIGEVTGSTPTRKTIYTGQDSRDYEYYNSAGALVGSSSGSRTFTGSVYSGWHSWEFVGPGIPVTLGWLVKNQAGAGPAPDPWSNCNVVFEDGIVVSGSWSTPVSYNSTYAADVAAGSSGTRSILYMSDQVRLATLLKVITSAGAESWTRYEVSETGVWNGTDWYDRVETYSNFSTYVYTKTVIESIQYSLPANCIGPLTPIPPAFVPASGIDDSSISISNLKDITSNLSLPAGQIAYGFSVTYSDSNTDVPVATVYRYITFSVYRYTETQEEANAAGRSRAYEYLYQATPAQLQTDWLAIRNEIDFIIRSTRAITDLEDPVPNPSIIAAQLSKHTDWYNKQDTLRARRDAFLLDSSNQILAAFVTPDESRQPLSWMWSNLVKVQSEWSDYVYRKYPLVVTKTDVVSVPVTDTTVTTRTAVYTYQYDKPNDEGGVDVATATQTIIGTKTDVTTRHAYGGIENYTQSVSYEWANYANLSLTTLRSNALGSALDQDVILTAKTYGSALHTVAQYTEFPGVSNGNYTGSPYFSYVASSAYGDVPNNPINFMAGFNPPPPNTLKSERQELPLIVKEYRKDVPLKYDENRPVADYRTCFNDSHMWSGMKINIVLYGPKGKGIFGEWGIADTEMDVYGTLSLSYNHYTAALTFKKWTPATPDTINTPHGPVSKPVVAFRGPGNSNRTNAVMGLGSIPWPDVKRRAKDKLAAIKAYGGKPREEQSVEYLVLHAIGRV